MYFVNVHKVKNVWQISFQNSGSSGTIILVGQQYLKTGDIHFPSWNQQKQQIIEKLYSEYYNVSVLWH